MRLLAFLLSQQSPDGWCGQDRAVTAVLCRGQAVSTAHLFRFLKLLVDVDRIVLKINTVPCQPQHFALPQSGEQGDLIHQPILRPLDRLQKSCDLRLLRRLDFFSVGLVGALILLDGWLLQLPFLVKPERTHLLAGFCRTINEPVAKFQPGIAHNAEVASAEFTDAESQITADVLRKDKLRKIFRPFRIQRIGKEVLNVIPLFIV